MSQAHSERGSKISEARPIEFTWCFDSKGELGETKAAHTSSYGKEERTPLSIHGKDSTVEQGLAHL